MSNNYFPPDFPVPPIKPSDTVEKDVEYLVVSDISPSKVILSTPDYKEAKKLASRIRAAGGSVTLFKSLKA
jgi:hypothetical protein